MPTLYSLGSSGSVLLCHTVNVIQDSGAYDGEQEMSFHWDTPPPEEPTYFLLNDYTEANKPILPAVMFHSHVSDILLHYA